MTGPILLAAAAIAVLAITRKTVDQLIRWRNWRVGRWGVLLCTWQRVGEACLACRTDYRYVLGHPIRYTGETRETARAIVPLCQRCWLELPQPERLRYSGEILTRWRQAGAYGAGDTFDQDTWDAHRLEVYAAVKGDL